MGMMMNVTMKVMGNVLGGNKPVLDFGLNGSGFSQDVVIPFLLGSAKGIEGKCCQLSVQSERLPGQWAHQQGQLRG